MPLRAQANHTVWTALLDDTSGEILRGRVLVLNEDGDRYLPSTAANRTAAARRSAGIALTSADGDLTHAVEFQFVGIVDASISALGAGDASALRVSSTGWLERVASPSVSDDVVGRCDADGTAYVNFSTVADVLASTGAPVAAQYVTLATHADLTVERVLTAGTGISVTDAGAGSTVTVANTVADAQYVTLATHATLANERVLTAGTGISLTDAGAGSTLTVASTITQGAPVGAQYVTLATHADLTVERVLTAGSNITLTDNGAGGTLVIAASGSATSIAGTGLWKNVSGTLQDPATLLVDADVDNSAAINYAKLASLPGSTGNAVVNDGGFIGVETSVFIGSSYVSIGATPAAAGTLRVPYNVGSVLAQRDNVNAGDWNLVKTNTTTAEFSDANLVTNHKSYTMAITAANSGGIDMNVASQYGLLVTNAAIYTAQPVAGDARATTPFRLKVASMSFSTLTDYTLSAAEYECPVWVITDDAGGPGSGSKELIAPSSAGAVVIIVNNMVATYVGLKDSGGAAATTEVHNGQVGMFVHDGNDWRNVALPT